MSVERLRALEAELAALQAQDAAEQTVAGCAASSCLSEPLSSPGLGGSNGWGDPGEAHGRCVPTLQQLCVDNIGTHLHLYACLQGLPEFVAEQLLEQFKTHFSNRHCKLRDDNISNWLDLTMSKREQQGRELTVLNLRWADGIGDAALEHVASRCTALRELDLAFCSSVGDAGVSAIAQGCGGTLLALDLTGCKAVTDRGVESIARRARGLRSLSLELTDVTDVAAQAAVRGLPQLLSLNLGAVRALSNVGIQIVASHGGRLLRLSLGGCSSLLDFDCEDLAKTCFSLQELVLRSCRRVTDEGAKHLGLLCKRQRSKSKDWPKTGALRMLDIGGCARIGDQGLAHIARYGAAIETLDARGLRLTRAGVRASLPSFRGLKTLVATGCDRIGDGEATEGELRDALVALCPTLVDVVV